MREKLTPEQEAVVCTDYTSSASYESISKKFGVSSSTIKRVLKKWGIPANGYGRRKYQVDETVFDSVTEESAYWVGFMMADGFVLRDRTGVPAVIGLGLAAEDKRHVEKFKTFLKSTHPIDDGPVSVRSGLPSAYIRFRSVPLATALCGYGVVPKKTYTATVVGLENNKHFWRGVIDGDGCIHTPSLRSGRKTTRLSLVGSRKLLTQFVEYAFTLDSGYVGHLRPQPSEKDKGSNSLIANLNYPPEVSRGLIRELYQGASIELERKMLLAQTAMQPLAKLTHCKHGHPTTPENRKMCNDGRTTYCLICDRIRTQRRVLAGEFKKKS